MTDTLQIKTFHDGRSAPTLGLGTWQIPDDQAPAVVEQAIGLGYRLIDTAKIYGNEAGVGKGIRASGIPREELFVATKLWHDSHAHGVSRPAFEASLERLGLDYVDLYMIHWPVPHANLFVQAWECLIQLRNEGLAKSIGVCNFDGVLLQELLDQTGVLPVVNQVELHPRFQQAELRQYHAANDIITEAWSPLAQGKLKDDPVLKRIAEQHGRSPAQVILRWHVQLGNMVIPKTTRMERLKENGAIFDFELTEADMAAISQLDSPDGRVGPDPATYG
jgi:Aldo/keto reductases, related to diketogulonate reductase